MTLVKMVMNEGRYKYTWRGLETLTLDACRRPLGWSWEGGLFRRALDGRTLRIEREPHPYLKMHRSRPVAREERDELLAMWARRLSLPDSWLEELARDEARFGELFRPISILPPDQYRALVLQLAQGCPWNKCSFCDLYRDRPFRAMTPAEFARHLEQVIQYFGPALEWRRGIFLGDANAGLLRQDQLMGALELLRKTFPPIWRDRHRLGFENVSAFLDTFSGRLRSVEDWRELRKLGLSQLHLGVESGSSEILQLLGKPSEPDRVVELVRRLKEAGIAVSVILMLGVGGFEGAAEHERRTSELLGRLPLDGADRVYLSELLVHPQSDYARLRLAEMSRPECRAQAERLRVGVSGPVVSLYDVRQFVYH